MINRRRFLKTSTTLSGVVIGFPAVARSADAAALSSGPKPRHIIHMVADGMCSGTFTSGDYLSLLLRRRGLTWTKLYNQPNARLGLMNMRSLNSYVTDSAAASSSWGSGSRIKNGVLNRLPDGTQLKTLYELFADQSWKRGLVTTTEITHATPAGFAVSVANRDDADMIAAQYLERRVDLLLGGGEKFFSRSSRKDKRDLYADYARAGYLVFKQASQLAEASLNRPWLGTFSSSHLPFSLDRQADAELVKRVPTLATMTRRALDWLQLHDHFILQIEGGRVDHAAHNNDAAAALNDLIAFDEAIDVVLAFQKTAPDTLLVITTDHGTGGLALNGMGSNYRDSISLFKNVPRIQCSFPEILRQMRNAPTKQPPIEDAAAEGGTLTAQPDGNSRDKDALPSPEHVAEVLLATTGYKVSGRRAAMFLPFLSKKGEALFKAMTSDVAGLGQLLGNHTGIGWTSTAHTSDFVPLLALGPGAERFAGYIQNVDVFRHYTQLAGIRFQNPQGQLITAIDPDQEASEDIDTYAERLA